MTTALNQADLLISNAVTLRRFTPSDVGAAQALSREMEWPHRAEDWQFALSHGQGVVAEKDGKVLGTVLTWHWGRRHATLGLVIVSSALQGKGIGSRMMEAALESLAGRTILLHSTEEGHGLYEKLGFIKTGEVAQHQGMPAVSPQASLDEASRDNEGDDIRALRSDDVEALISLDARGAGMPRDELVRRLFNSEQTLVLTREGRVAGYAVLRQFGRGQAIGPVAAPDFNAARLLIDACRRRATGFLRIDVDVSSGLSAWLESIGLPRTGSGSIMVRGAAPLRGPAHGGWALVTQALG